VLLVAAGAGAWVINPGNWRGLSPGAKPNASAGMSAATGVSANSAPSPGRPIGDARTAPAPSVTTDANGATLSTGPDLAKQQVGTKLVLERTIAAGTLEAPPWGAEFSPDFSKVLVYDSWRTRVFDAHSGTKLLELAEGIGGLCAKFSPDGSKILVAN